MSENAQRNKAPRISPAILSGLSREIIVPLKEVLANIDRIESAGLKGKQRKLLWAAQSSAISACSVLESLADLPAFDESDRILDLSVFSLDTTIESVASSLVPLAADRGLYLRCAIEDAIAGRVEGDRPRLRQLLTYLTGLVIRGAEGRDVTLRAISQSQDLGGRSVIIQVNAPKTRPGADDIAACTDRASWALYRHLAAAMGGVIGVEHDQAHGLTAYCTVSFADPGTNCDERDLARRRRPALRCNLGKVEDLSLAGMRMSCLRKLSGNVRLKIEHGTNLVRCRARVVWNRRLEDRSHEIGLRFVKLPPEQVALIHRMSEN